MLIYNCGRCITTVNYTTVYASLKIEKAAVVCPTVGFAPLPKGDNVIVFP